MQRVLITGAGGYLGQALARRLVELDCALVRASRTSGLTRLSERDVLLRVDNYGEPAFWQRAVQEIDVVYHLAGQTSVYEAARDPRADWHANVEPMLLLVEACRQQEHRPIVVFAGTATQAGLVTSLPASEEVEDAPVSIYDAHKLAAETYLKVYCRIGAIRGVSLRLTNVYGPGRSSNPQRGVLNRMVRQALRGERLTIYGAGEYLRDYVYIDDVVDAMALAPAAIERLNGGHFLVGSGQGQSLVTAFHLVAELVAEMTCRPAVAVEHIEPPAGLSPLETRDFVADTTRFRTASGWAAQVAFREGLRRTIESERSSTRGYGIAPG